jgi:hypothetical protein
VLILPGGLLLKHVVDVVPPCEPALNFKGWELAAASAARVILVCLARTAIGRCRVLALQRLRVFWSASSGLADLFGLI